jgi:peptidoglycan hydrolase-like protein with peptidoglycan-binding domain
VTQVRQPVDCCFAMKTFELRRIVCRRAALILAGIISVSSAWADDLTLAVQQRLKDRGFYYGQADGQSGSETLAAIRRYQIRYGLKVSGELNQETLNSLGLSASNLSAAPSATPRVPQANRSGQVLQPNSTPSTIQRRRIPSNDEEYVDPRNYPPNEEAQPSTETANYRTIYAGTLYARAPDQVQQSVMQGIQTQLARWGFYGGGIDGLPGTETTQAIREFQQQSGLPPTGRLDNWTLQALRALPGQRNGPHIRRAPVDPYFRRGPYPFFRETEQESWD